MDTKSVMFDDNIKGGVLDPFFLVGISSCSVSDVKIVSCGALSRSFEMDVDLIFDFVIRSGGGRCFSTMVVIGDDLPTTSGKDTDLRVLNS